MSEKYYESLIKSDVLSSLRRRRIINRHSIIASEFVLGSTGRRADLAVYNGTSFVGIEIKSKHDSLRRLRDQLETYNSCFDEVLLVLHERHLNEAFHIAPPNVPIFSITKSDQMSLVREASGSSKKNASTSLKLLTLAELKRLVGLPAGSLAKRADLLRAARQLPDSVIFDAVTASFMKTYSETSAKFWHHVRKRNISIDAMSHLSRFSSERADLIQRKERQQLFWNQWKDQAAEAIKAAARTQRSLHSISPG